MLIDYKVPRTEDCLLMDVNAWVPTSTIVSQSIKGKLSASYVTTVLDENFKEDYGISKGDTILITRISSEIAPMRSYDLNDGKKYFNLPISQVIGKFKNSEISLESLQLIDGKVLIEKLDRKSSDLYLPEVSDMLGRVVQANSKIESLKEGNIVFLKDNIATPIRLDEKEYYAADDINVVGVLSYGLSAEDIEFINGSILMLPYISSYVLNSSLLVTPDVDYENLDYSDIYNRDLFQIKFLDKNVEGLKKDDVVLLRRDLTTYVYINNQKYFLIDGKKWIEAKIEE